MKSNLRMAATHMASRVSSLKLANLSVTVGDLDAANVLMAKANEHFEQALTYRAASLAEVSS